MNEVEMELDGSRYGRSVEGEFALVTDRELKASKLVLGYPSPSSLLDK